MLQRLIGLKIKLSKLSIIPLPALVIFSIFGPIPVYLKSAAEAARVKDIATIVGVRENQLVGYGLVVGLDKTGDDDSTGFTVQSLVSMFNRLGITLDPRQVEVKNVAAVIVTANLRPFARAGTRIDALVSSIGNATSLRGGTLLYTPLKGGDSKVYAVAQGPVSIGGFSFAGAGASASKNHPTVGRIVGGALIEREVAFDFSAKKSIKLALNNPDFTTAARLASAINERFKAELAKPLDAGTIEVALLDTMAQNTVEMVAIMEAIEIKPDSRAKVVLDERTGTVVMGENVRLSTIAVSHGSLSVQIKEQPKVSQPLPFSQGATVVVPDTQMEVKEQEAKLMVVEQGISIGEVVKALNAIGVSPRDLIAVFQAIKAAGALQADLEII